MSVTMIEPWVGVPRWWYEAVEMDASKLGLLVILAGYVRPGDPTCWPAQGTLAKLAGRSRAWVNKMLSELADLGIVEKTNRTRQDKGATSCMYRIHFTQDVRATVIPSRSSGALPHEFTPPVSKDDTNKNQSNNTHSDGNSWVEWNPAADVVAEIERQVGADEARLYVDRFLRRCRAKYHYKLEEMEAALRRWFREDLASGYFAKRSARRSAGSKPLPVRPDDRVTVSAIQANGDEAAQRVAQAIEAGQDAAQISCTPEQRAAGALMSFLPIHGRAVYDSWLRGLQFARMSGDTLVLTAPGTYHASYCRQHHLGELQRALHLAGFDVGSVHIEAQQMQAAA
jgi:hypothetical protein